MKVKMGWMCSLEGKIKNMEFWWGNNIKQDLRKVIRM
jgi:hypothetical protein